MAETVTSVEVRTAVAAAFGCPYGLAAEQSIVANEMYISDTNSLLISDVGEDQYFAAVQTSIEADDTGEDLAKGILACDTCNGDPHRVDLTNKVCAFALELASGGIFVAKDLREFIESGDSYGS